MLRQMRCLAWAQSARRAGSAQACCPCLQASLRYTRQAIRMRVADSIVLRLTAQPIPEWAELVAAQRAAAAAERAQQAQQAAEAEAARAVDDAAASGASIDVPDDLLSAIVQAAEAQRSGSSFDEASPPATPAASGGPSEPAASAASGGRPLTVAERLQAEYAARQAGEEGAAPQAQRQLTDLERRQRRRKEYFAQVMVQGCWSGLCLLLCALQSPPLLAALCASLGTRHAPAASTPCAPLPPSPHPTPPHLKISMEGSV